MPKKKAPETTSPRVTEDSRKYGTPKTGDWYPAYRDESQGTDQDLNKLSFLHGATVDGGSDDMGYPESSPFNTGIASNSIDDWQEKWRAKEALRRHTIDQGMSTFSWPKKP